MSRSIPTAEEFTTLYPQFANAAYAAQVQAQLDVSSRLLLVDAWDDFYSDAVMLDCAHNLLLTLQGQTGGLTGGLQIAAGPISSVSVGGVSTSFATSAVDSSKDTKVWYSKTAFGQQFLRLKATVCPMGFIT